MVVEEEEHTQLQEETQLLPVRTIQCPWQCPVNHHMHPPPYHIHDRATPHTYRIRATRHKVQHLEKFSEKNSVSAQVFTALHNHQRPYF